MELDDALDLGAKALIKIRPGTYDARTREDYRKRYDDINNAIAMLRDLKKGTNNLEIEKLVDSLDLAVKALMKVRPGTYDAGTRDDYRKRYDDINDAIATIKSFKKGLLDGKT